MEKSADPIEERWQLLARAVSGLRPEAWICVGTGYSREWVKAELLSRGARLAGDAVITQSELARKIMGVESTRVLGEFARTDALRVLFSQPALRRHLKELQRLRRQRGFFRKLDQAVQAGRSAFAHARDQEVVAQVLEERFGQIELRSELAAFATAYDAWLAAASLWDEPRLLREAAESLRERKSIAALPRRIVLFHGARMEPLEAGFFEELSRSCECTRADDPVAVSSPDVRVERWHTIDDAVESLLDRIPFGDWHRHMLLVPDDSAVRRALQRAIAERGIPVADYRDPSQLKSSEALKHALLPLELVVSGFERETVIAWIESGLAGLSSASERAEWIREINARGIRRGLDRYRGGRLDSLQAALKPIHEAFGGRVTLKALAERHLQFVSERAAVSGLASAPWAVVSRFFERMWSELVTDVDLVQPQERAAPLLHWWEGIQERVAYASPAPGAVSPREGLRIFRPQQLNLSRHPFVWILGLPSAWLSSAGTGSAAGDLWYSQRERESIGSEFGLRSSHDVVRERVSALLGWVGAADSVCFLDYAYAPDGAEREGLLPTLRPVFLSLGAEVPEISERGAHARWRGAYRLSMMVQPESVDLAPLAEIRPNPVSISADELDRYSRCGFLGLASSRWRLEDLRKPGLDLWPEVKGRILHRAAEILVSGRDAWGESESRILAAAALDRAFAEVGSKGIFESTVLKAQVRRRLVRVLVAFVDCEREYLERAQTRVLSLESQERLEREYSGVVVRGIPDRIDEHADGLFIMDYKTGSQLPSGRDMVDLKCRLQLPFYALAAREKFKREVLGVQFVQLNSSASRTQGIFLKKYNGSKSGMLVNTRSKLNVFDAEADALWRDLNQGVAEAVQKLSQGQYIAAPPKGEVECRSCFFPDLCGLQRRQLLNSTA